MRARPSAILAVSILCGTAYSQEQPPRAEHTLAGEGDTVPTDPARWFLAAKADLGYAYIRPRLSAGYGRPHRHWFGLDVNPIVSTSAAGGYAGLRYENPYVDLRTGGLYAVSFARSFLPVLDHYDWRDAELRVGSSAEYGSWDSELELNIPVGFGKIISESQPVVLFGIPENNALFVETVRVITQGPWVYRQRVGYTFPTPGIEGLHAALVGEVVILPDRNTQVWRAGVTLRWWLFPSLQLRINMVPVITGPDNLGLEGADLGQLGIRWFWATH